METEVVEEVFADLLENRVCEEDEKPLYENWSIIDKVLVALEDAE